MQLLSLIVCYAQHRVIGFNNQLPWHLPEDLKRFKALTLGHHIVMGRKTYESLGRLLPGRTSVIVTRNPNFKVEGAHIAHSLEQAISLCKQADGVPDDEVFLIGGEQLFKTALTLAERLYVTELEVSVQGDAFFPAIDNALWQEIKRESHISNTGLKFAYVDYMRKV